MTRKAAPAAEPEALDPRQLFRGLAAARGLVLAVSGGPDSTALMQLVSGWAERPPVLVVTFDHGLRAEAASEARMVAANAERLGLPWRVMRAEEEQTGNLQDWARRARYRALAAAAGDAGFDTIVTAHHLEDQAETFLLRLARGSGVYGLAAMAEDGAVEGLRLARPLLGVPRQALAAIAAASGLPIAADPSNLDTRFDRVRMRGIMPALAAEGLTAARLAETAGRMRRAAEALDHYARRLIAEHFSADGFGVVRGDAAAFGAAPEEVGLRALSLILQAVGGAEYTSRLHSVEALRSSLIGLPAETTLRRTLHGVVVGVRRGRFTARREWGRKGLAAIRAPAGATLVWDRRFRIDVPDLSGALDVGPLGGSQRRLSAGAGDRGTLETLPGLFRDGELASVPEGVHAVDEGPRLGRLTAESIVASRLSANEDGLSPADRLPGSAAP